MQCNKPTPLHNAQYPDLFFSYKDGFNLNTGKRNPLHLPEDDKIIQYSSQNQHITGGPIKENDKCLLPPLNSTNIFTTIDYNAHVNTKNDYGIKHVFETMTVLELNTLNTVCELERTQFLTILAVSGKNPQLAGVSLTQNRSNFLYVEGSTAWLYDCPHHLSPLYIAEKCYDKSPNNYLDTVKYVDPITRQTFDYATPTPCEKFLKT